MTDSQSSSSRSRLWLAIWISAVAGVVVALCTVVRLVGFGEGPAPSITASIKYGESKGNFEPTPYSYPGFWQVTIENHSNITAKGVKVVVPGKKILFTVPTDATSDGIIYSRRRCLGNKYRVGDVSPGQRTVVIAFTEYIPNAGLYEEFQVTASNLKVKKTKEWF